MMPNSNSPRNRNGNAAQLFRQYLTTTTSSSRNDSPKSSHDPNGIYAQRHGAPQTPIDSHKGKSLTQEDMGDVDHREKEEEEKEVTHILGEVTLSPQASFDEHSRDKHGDEDNNENTISNHTIEHDNSVSSEGTSFSFDEDLGGISGNHAQRDLHFPAKSELLHNVPLIAIHSRGVTGQLHKARKPPPRRYNKALLDRSTLWSNTQSVGQTPHNVQSHINKSSPSSSSSRTNSTHRPVSEHLTRPTEADKSRMWNHPRNQLSRRDSMNSMSSGRRSRTVSQEDISPGDRRNSIVSVDEELGGAQPMDNVQLIDGDAEQPEHSGLEVSSARQHKKVTINDVANGTTHDTDSSHIQHLQQQRKQQQLYERLCTPTKSFENGRYKPFHDEKNRKVKTHMPPSTNLTKPTVAAIHSRWSGIKEEDHVQRVRRERMLLSSEKAIQKPISSHILTPTKQNRASMPFYNGSLAAIISSASDQSRDASDVGEGWVGVLENYKINQRERRKTLTAIPDAVSDPAANTSLGHDDSSSRYRRLVPTPPTSHKYPSRIWAPDHEISTGFYFEGGSTAASSPIAAASPHYSSHHYQNHHSNHDHETEETPCGHESVLHHSTVVTRAVPSTRGLSIRHEQLMNQESNEADDENIQELSMDDGDGHSDDRDAAGSDDDDDDDDDENYQYHDAHDGAVGGSNGESQFQFEEDHDPHGDNDQLEDGEVESSEDIIQLQRQGLQRVFPPVPEPTSPEYHDLYDNAMEINADDDDENFHVYNMKDGASGLDDVHVVSSSFERAVGEMMVLNNNK